MTGEDTEPLVGEQLALDLLNTRPAGLEGRKDLLATAQLLARWLDLQGARLAGAAGDGTAPQRADLAPVHAVRDHTEAAVRALMRGARPPASALRGLNQAMGAAPSVPELHWDGTAVTITPRRPGRLGIRLAAVLAQSAADLLTDPAFERVKECEADGCVMLFLPAHPRRRWCVSAKCGNRARVARHYRRQRDGSREPSL
ncbi:CGNR zinc finger domain-containing protein [Streptomyces orinoci]|uniref:ABATE domain-containing protein n=1 Tax=Streptomyces orinoci TaxID=67339 RepID=A0ABV3JV76_STRON|nr:ABATE domain-containing protein [Streptomyces orinoci]